MPITKSGGALLYTPALDFNDFLQTGVSRADQFALCDKIDRLKQIAFDTSPQASNTVLTLRSGAISANTVITLPSSSGTLASTSFGIIQTPSGTSPTATTANDTLIFAVTATSGNLSITGNSGTKTATFGLNQTLVDTSGVATLGLTVRNLRDTSGFTSLSWDVRGLFDSFSIPSIDWQNRRAYYGSGAAICLDYSLGLGYDSSGESSIYWGGRFLYDIGSVVTMDWNARQTFDGDGNITIDWGNQTLGNGSGTSVFFGGYQLQVGGSASLDWFSRIGYDSLGASAYDWSSRLLLNASGGTVLNWSTLTLTDNSNVASLIWASRILADSSGTTCFNWSSTSGLTVTKKIVSYNGDSTVGNGVASVVGNVDLSTQSASIADTTIFTPVAAGMYQLLVYAEVTTSGTAGTLAVQIKYSDDNGAQAVDPLPVATLSLTATGFSQGSIVIRSGSATAIKYNTTVTGVVGSPRYALKIVLKRLS